MKVKKSCAVFAAFCLICAVLSGCGDVSPDKRTELTFWYELGAEDGSPISELVAVFNDTAGAENGIIIVPECIADSGDILQTVLSGSERERRTPELPDIFLYFDDYGSPGQELTDWRGVYSDAELEAFDGALLAAGSYGGRLCAVPFALYTDVLFVNTQKTGLGGGGDMPSSWPALLDEAEKYAASDAGGAFLYVEHPLDMFVSALTPADGADEIFPDRGAFSSFSEACAAAYNGGGIYSSSFDCCSALLSGKAAVAYAPSYYISRISALRPDEGGVADVAIAPAPSGGASLLHSIGIAARPLSGDAARAASVFCKWMTDPENSAEYLLRSGCVPARSSARAAGEGLSDIPGAETIAGIMSSGSFISLPGDQGMAALNDTLLGLHLLDPAELPGSYDAVSGVSAGSVGLRWQA